MRLPSLINWPIYLHRWFGMGLMMIARGFLFQQSIHLKQCLIRMNEMNLIIPAFAYWSKESPVSIMKSGIFFRLFICHIWYFEFTVFRAIFWTIRYEICAHQVLMHGFFMRYDREHLFPFEKRIDIFVQSFLCQFFSGYSDVMVTLCAFQHWKHCNSKIICIVRLLLSVWFGI